MDTWPVSAANLNLNDTLIEDLQNVDIDTVESQGTLPTYGVASGLTLAMMIGKEYDDPQWKSEGELQISPKCVDGERI